MKRLQLCESSSLAQLPHNSTRLECQPVEICSCRTPSLPHLIITCLRSLARREPVVQQMLQQIGVSSSPLPAASASLAAAAADSNNCQQEGSSLNGCSYSGGVGGKLLSVLVFTIFSSFISEFGANFGHGLARGAGWRASTARLAVHRTRREGRRVHGGSMGEGRRVHLPPVTAPHLDDRFHCTTP